MAFDVPALIAEIKDISTGILKKDVTQLRGFSARQVEALARQTALVSAGIASGEITEETRDFFLDNLEDMALNFVKTLRGLLQITIEKLWNGVVGALWKAISGATGITLPTP